MAKNFGAIGIALAILALFTLGACTWLKSASVQAVITAAEDAGCKQETAAGQAFANSVAATLNCTSPDAIKASFMTALGNINFCSKLQAASASGMKAQGVIANLICPMGVSAAIGFVTQAVPPAWGCTVSTNAAGVYSSLVSICETLPF